MTETLYPFDLVAPICGGPTMTVLELLEGDDKSAWVSVQWWDGRGQLQEAVLPQRSVKLLDLEQAIPMRFPSDGPSVAASKSRSPRRPR